MFEFTDEQKLLKRLVQEFTENEILTRDRRLQENGADVEVLRKAAELGITGINIPLEYGGAGGDAVACTIICHEMAKGSPSLAMTLDINWVANDILLKYGTAAQKDLYLREAAKGELFAFCLTEAGCGSDAGGLKTFAKKTETGWCLNGGKAWITNAGIAKYYIVIAATAITEGKKEISAFIVHDNDAGFSIGEHEDKMGMRGSDTAELYFDNVMLPDDRLIGKRGQGFKMALESLDGGRISIGAIALGLSEKAIELSRNYANEREAFGSKISQFEAIQFKFADMATNTEAARLLVYEASLKKASGLKHTKEAAMAKLFASSHCTQICLEALQVFGGNGYSKEYPLERMVRDAKLLEIGEGTSEVLRMVIGKTTLAAK